MAAPYTNIKFSDAAMPRIAQATGYKNPSYNKEGFQAFLAQDPAAKAKYEQFQQQAVGTMMAARGGAVRFNDGGVVRKYAVGGAAPAVPNNVTPVQPQTQTTPPITTTPPVPTMPTTQPENPETFTNPANVTYGKAGEDYTYTQQSAAAQVPVLENYLKTNPTGPDAEYYREWLKNYDKSYNPERQEGIVGDKYVSFDYTTYPPTKVETSADSDELRRIGDTRENERTPEDVEKLNALRKITPLTLDDGTTLSATNARARYDQIAIKRQDTVTAEDRAFAKQFRAQYGFPPLPEADEDVGSPEIVLRTVAQMEGLTAEGENILTEGMTIDPTGIEEKKDQDVAVGTGEVTGDVTADVTTATTDQAENVIADDAVTMDTVSTEADVKDSLSGLEAEQGVVDTAITAEEEYKTNVSDVKAEQTSGILLDNEITREIQDGELVSPTANAEKAAAFAEQVQAATATPTEKATVKGQLEDLYSDFDAAEPPPWASGAMRAANSAMAARGLSASSIAGQAVIQATMEAAIPIAQADASVFATFEQTNLSNRQQRAMLAAQQRAAFIGQEFDQAFQARVANAAKISDVANMNFNAEQQIQLENSRIANTVNLQNLSNRQATVMAEAAALANLEMSSLNNRQQAAVQNAQNFLQMDLANLGNRQQTSMFKSQQTIQSMFNDAAAENAARQFNATSENQTNQFFANLRTTTDQFNTAQANAISQFNAGQVNATSQFNATVRNQREQFNKQNAVTIAQSNAVWRRQIATADTAAINRANELNARSTLELSTLAYNNMWGLYKDIFEFAFQAEQGDLERANRLAVAEEQASARSSGGSFGQLAGSIVGGIAGKFFSDIRLKTNIEPIEDFGNGVKLYKWEWRNKAKKLDVNIRQNRGFIAQNVLKYFPELVHKDQEEEYYKVDYLGVVKKCLT